MRLVYRNKYIDLIECKSFFSRFKGNMLKKEISNALLFNHCSSIHTFFMKKCIDVILCDKDNVILYYYQSVGPNRIILPKKGVSKVYELPAYCFDNIHIKDRLEVK